MSESAGKTPQDNASQPAKPGAVQPHETVNPGPSEVTIPPATKEPFLAINVREGASLEEIVDSH